MRELIRFDWQAFDFADGAKVAIGLVVMLLLAHLTGEPFLATGLAALFAWMANVPGPLKNRLGGMLAFAVGAILITLVSGWIGLALWPNVIAIAVIAVLGTLALALGTRAFMVGFSLICWAIYGPFLIATTSVGNCLLAILAGTGILALLNAVGEKIGSKSTETAAGEPSAPAENATAKPGISYVTAYAITVALVLAVTTYYGWVELKTDPTLMAGGAFFVIGFDANKTWVAGLGRLIGLAAGASLGLLIAQLLGQGLLLEAIMIAACGLSFAARAVHPAAWMFWFMMFVAIGWHGLEPEALDLTVKERLYGETAGVTAAMLAIMFLQWWQSRRSR